MTDLNAIARKLGEDARAAMVKRSAQVKIEAASLTLSQGEERITIQLPAIQKLNSLHKKR